MSVFILALTLIALALLATALQKTYSLLPAKELKRRARAGDPLYKALYRAAAYGTSLRVLLWTVIVLGFAASFVLLSRAASPVLAFVAVVLIMVYGFVWSPSGQTSEAV